MHINSNKIKIEYLKTKGDTMKKNNQRQGWLKQFFKNLASLTVKQVIATSLCFFLIYGACNNEGLSAYTSSLGRAIRYDSNLGEKLKSATDFVKELFSPKEEIPYDDGITFQ